MPFCETHGIELSIEVASGQPFLSLVKLHRFRLAHCAFVADQIPSLLAQLARLRQEVHLFEP